MNPLLYVLWWIGGSSVDIVAACDPCVRRRHTARGIVFTLNYLFLIGVWTSVGYEYFGPRGIVCPGLIVPSILVLGLGRLIAMQPRRIVSLNSAGGPAVAAHPRRTWLPRVVIALILSSSTTLSLMMVESRDLIHNSAMEMARSANSSLYNEKTRITQAKFAALEAAHQARVQDLAKERDIENERLANATTALDAANTKLEQAEREASYEQGGLDSRRSGKGTRYHAWQTLHEHYSDVVGKESGKQQLALQNIGRLNVDIDAERRQLGQFGADRQKQLDGLDQAVRSEAGYVAPTQGLFSDATLFLGLYGKSDVGPGMRIVSIIVALFLFVIELSDLIAVSLSPCEITPLVELASIRVTTAKLITDAEIALARSNSSRPIPWIEALNGRRARGGLREASGSSEGDGWVEIGSATPSI
jgi:hypothetical protein